MRVAEGEGGLDLGVGMALKSPLTHEPCGNYGIFRYVQRAYFQQ